MNKIQDVITAACRKLEDTVQDMGVTLKFDISSVSLLEEIILAIKQLGDKSALSGACFMVGSYLGEIFRRELGGEWAAPGEGETPSILIDDMHIFPIEKVRKFSETPSAESLTFYADTILAKVKGARPN